MAFKRIRTIKPEINDDEKAAGLSSDAWRLWVSMWTLADDAGRLRGGIDWLKGQVFWAPLHASVRVGELLIELERAEMIRRYSVRGQQYIEVQNWLKHQKIDKPSASKLPGYEESDTCTPFVEKPREASANVREDSSKDLGPRTKDRGPKDSREVSRESSPGLALVPTEPPPLDLEAVYGCYPRKVDKSAGMDALRKSVKTPEDYALCLVAVRNFAVYHEREQTEEKYIPYFGKFARRWRDWLEPPKSTTSSHPRSAKGWAAPSKSTEETHDATHKL